MNYTITEPRSYKRIPWKNGLGYTTEIKVAHAGDTDRFAWRLSIASVTEDGPFSDFSGYERCLTLINGNGIKLEYGNGTQDVLARRFDMALFSGDWKTTGFLIDGPIEDFNVMTCRDTCLAKVEVLNGSGFYALNESCDELLIYPLDEDIQIDPGNSGNKISLPVKHTFHATGSDNISLTIEGNAIVTIRIMYQNNQSV